MENEEKRLRCSSSSPDNAVTATVDISSSDDLATTTNESISGSISQAKQQHCAAQMQMQAKNNEPAPGVNAKAGPKGYHRTRSYDEIYQSKAKSFKPKTQQRRHDNSATLKHPCASAYHAQGASLRRGTFDAYRRPYEPCYGAPSYGYQSQNAFTVYSQAPHVQPQPDFDAHLYSSYYPDETMRGEKALNFAQQQQHVNLVYRSTPLLNYGANSYFGWHRAPAPAFRSPPALPPVNPIRNGTTAAPCTFLDSTDQLASSFRTTTTTSCAPLHAGAAASPEMANTPSVLYDKETVSPFFKDIRQQRKRRKRNARCSVSSSFCAESLSSTSTASIQRNRLKLCVISSILVIIIAVLVAMGIAVYSQVKTQNSVVKLVRQYRSSFVVTGGRQLDYDADILNTQSQSFKAKSKTFEKKIDFIFHGSGLTTVYESCDVTAFRFVTEPPGMEVHFNLKTKVNVQLQVGDVLAILDDAVRRNANGVFTDAAVDPKSLTVEGQRIQK